jgi:hypothetical protein
VFVEVPVFVEVFFCLSPAVNDAPAKSLHFFFTFSAKL